MKEVFIALIAVFPLLGLVSGRWAAAALPLVGWPLFYIGLDGGWWGSGTGDGWQALALLMTAVGVVSTAAAVAVRRIVSSARAGAPPAGARGPRRPSP